MLTKTDARREDRSGKDGFLAEELPLGEVIRVVLSEEVPFVWRTGW